MNLSLKQSFPSFKWHQYSILILLALYPVIAVSVPGGGSIIYALLILPSLIFGWTGWKQLSVIERQWTLSLIALFIIASLSLIYSEELRDGAKRLERYFRLMTFPLIYLMMRRLNIEAGKLFLIGIGAATISLAGQAYYEIQILNKEIASGLYHKIIFGDMAVLTASILVAASLTIVRQRWLNLVVAICVFAAIYAALASMARGAWLLIPFNIALLIWLYRHKISPKQWMTIGILLVIAISALSIWTPKKIESGIQQGYSDLIAFNDNPGSHSSWGLRLNMWRNSMIIWSKSPAIGTGIGDFQYDSRQMWITKESLNVYAHVFDHAHSIYFDSLATMGLFGLLMIIITLIVIPWRIFMSYWGTHETPWIRFYALSGILTTSSFAFFGLTEGWLSRNAFINPYIIYLVVFLASIKTRRKRQSI